MTTFNRTPGAYTVMRDDEVKTSLDKDMKTIYDVHKSLDGVAIKGPGAGFTFQSGSTVVLGSKTRIQTGIRVIDHVIASIDNGAVATNQTVTARVTPANKSQIDLYCWQPTAAGNTTPVASTVQVTVRWVVTGASQ